MNKFIFLLIFLKAFVTGQNLSDLSDESYKIYSTVIDSYFDYSLEKSIVISDSTMLDFFYSDLRVKYDPDSLYLKNILSSFKINCLDEILRDYNFKKRDKYKIREDKFSSKRELIFIKHSSFKKYFSQKSVKQGWKYFYNDFPNSIGYIKFTKVGFNQLKNKAIVYLEKYCGGTCGFGMYFLLQKEKNSWKIIDKKEIWVS